MSYSSQPDGEGYAFDMLVFCLYIFLFTVFTVSHSYFDECGTRWCTWGSRKSLCRPNTLNLWPRVKWWQRNCCVLTLFSFCSYQKFNFKLVIMLSSFVKKFVIQKANCFPVFMRMFTCTLTIFSIKIWQSVK